MNILLHKQAELTDCIYGIIQYVQEQSYKQHQIDQFSYRQNVKVASFIKTGKVLAPNDTTPEDSEVG
jgi:hypothetical protein